MIYAEVKAYLQVFFYTKAPLQQKKSELLLLRDEVDAMVAALVASDAMLAPPTDAIPGPLPTQSNGGIDHA